MEQQSMNIMELIKAAKEFKLTPEYIESMRERAREAEKRFEQEDWDRRVTQEMLNRSYSI